MANPGGVGPKFVSVNLNKSYGQSSHLNHSPYSGSYGQAAASRVRPGSGGGGGGMVVLSRSRGSQKPVPRLSVPPPLNLPSLRKEHERFDLSGSVGGSAGGAGSGSGSRPSSSGMGWTKPVSISLQDKDRGGGVLEGSSDTPVVDAMNQNEHAVDGVPRGNSVYMPPSARSGGIALIESGSVRAYPPQTEKATVLRGEDFPSLKAALPATSGPAQKQKESLHQKQKQMIVEESSNELRDNYDHSSPNHMHRQGQPYHHTFGNGLGEDRGEGRGLGSSWMADKARKKEEFFPGPLPLVRFNPRSDWADDERDTGHGFADRGRDNLKSEGYWDRDFDLPRSSVLPHKPAHNVTEKWGQRNTETGKGSLTDIHKVDPCRRDLITPSREGREGSTWRTYPFLRDGFSAQQVNDKIGISARPTGPNRDMGKETKYAQSPSRDHVWDGAGMRILDPAFERRERGHVREEREQWNKSVESFTSRGSERNARDRYGNEQSGRFPSDAFQGKSVSKPSYSAAGKGLPMNDPILNFGRDKHSFSESERPFLKDFGSTGFDERDSFPGGPVGVIKRKKDVARQADFHDPVRESFEAELERVQKMQEMERQRIIEEQERALEQARREEEERQRLIREEEERRRRREEEAQEAARRAEQERLEAIQRAEEQKAAREEEKIRIIMEEERRKQAAKQKLLELEARIAKRHAEATKSDSSTTVTGEIMPTLAKENDGSRAADSDTWEDSERMMERITTASSDSSIRSRAYDMGSRPQPPREGSSAVMDRVKPVNSWRRDVFENGNISAFSLQEHENVNCGPKRDASLGGRPFPKKEFYGAAGSSRNYFKGAKQGTYADEFDHLREQRWSSSGVGDSYSKHRDVEPEFQANPARRYGDVGWGQDHSRSNPHSPYPERLYLEAEELYSYGRSRYSMRQPRVLPPPSLTSLHNAPYRGENEHPGPSTSTFLDNDTHYNHATRSESTMQTGYYVRHLEKLEPSELDDVQPENVMSEDKKLDNDTAPRCDSPSSLSVSSPPNSPTHLSHDEFDENVDSAVEGKKISMPDNGSVFLNEKSEKDIMMTASVSISAGEDEEWTLYTNEELREQEEYDEDEDEDGYREGDEVREGDDDDLDLTQDFENIHLEEKESSHMIDNLVLGFDDGVEVRIPSDDFERNSRNEESKFGIPDVSVAIVEEQASGDAAQGDGLSLRPGDGSHPSDRIQETGKAMHDLANQPISATLTSTSSDLFDNIDPSNTSAISAHQHTVSSSVDMASHSSGGHNVPSSASSVPSKADLPVKLQFGLFSGPSLIPSPVPAIQIGSIQMPLHLHSPVGPSLTHIHPSHPPLFQFGQLRYTSPISQGILPMAPQSIPFVQPNVQTHYNPNQSAGGSLHVQLCQDSYIMKDDVPSLSGNNLPGVFSRPLDLSDENVSRGLLNSFSMRAEGKAMMNQSQAEISSADDNKITSAAGSQAEDRQQNTVKNCILSSKERGPEGQLQSAPASSQSVSSEKKFSGPKAQGPFSGSKGKKKSYSARTSYLRSSYPGFEASRDSSGLQRRPRRAIHQTEFRIGENAGRGQPSSLVSSSNSGLDDKSNFNGRGVGIFPSGGSKRGSTSDKPLKQVVEFESSNSVLVDSGNRAGKISAKAAATKNWSISHPGEGNLKRNISDEDADAPLQSGVVRVFKQPGIEGPSDEDDFIEVRSKKQMLHDRREQREKEIKAKSGVSKLPRKPRSTVQSTVGSTSSNKICAALGGEAPNIVRPDLAASEERNPANKEVSSGVTCMASQPLAPIGTPAVNSDAQADTRSHTIKSLHTGSVSIVSDSGKDIGSGLIFETKNKVLDTVQTSLGSWGNTRINQQVMSLTQTQLDEAMKPARFDTHVTSIGGDTSAVSEPILPSSSLLTKEKSFSSSASPINSLLAGEKIQFGAVTSPTVIPLHGHAASHEIGASDSGLSDVQISHNISAPESDCSLFFEKDKHSTESCTHFEDCEAEAEAAASAVAVAAISNDEIVGNGCGFVCVSDSKSFGGPDIGITGGVAADPQLANQSRVEDSLSVSLPADLSVDTPPISLWQPLLSPHNSSSQMLSHFPRGPPSHFPFYEMNPMLGGPIFAFGQHEESSGTQSQSQKSTTSGSGHIGAWQQCHSTVDSFYGPPAGFTGPFISPPAGIPGVQGAPHMVVYNHFAPVGQFGQVGLSFMGTTYFPSGKQPDWKHNPSSSAMGFGEGDMNNMNVSSAQRNPPNMPAPIQHLAPSSPLLPMASPLAMFDVSPFQSTPDMSVHARWSHVPASPLHSIPSSQPLQQAAEGILPSQFSHSHSVNHSMTIGNRFSESQTSTPSENGQNFAVVTEASVSQFPNELGLVDLSSPAAGGSPSAQGVVDQSFTGRVISDAVMPDALLNGSSNNKKGQSMNALKNQLSQSKNPSAQPYNNSHGYNYQRGGVFQKNNSSGGEWSHRRMGIHGRNPSLSAEKGFPSKMKQIYVAKQTTTGTTTAG